MRSFKEENREGHGPKMGRRAIEGEEEKEKEEGEEEEEEKEEGEMYIHTSLFISFGIV
jgi:hypothetical protein